MIINSKKSVREYKYNCNCFDAIRLFAALQVMYFHLIEHFKITTQGLIFERIFKDFSGVIIFFSISAFLITASYERCTDVKQYVKKRFLRIYPAMWCAVLVSLFSILLLYREHMSGGGQIVKWIVASVTCAQFYTPNYLRGYGVGAPNGSLWTICVEIQAYIFIAVSYKFIKGIKANSRILLIICCMLISYFGDYFVNCVPDLIYKLFRVTLIPYLYIFLLGMTIYLDREKNHTNTFAVLVYYFGIVVFSFYWDI